MVVDDNVLVAVLRHRGKDFPDPVSQQLNIILFVVARANHAD
jgi:hypothetical protein